MSDSAASKPKTSPVRLLVLCVILVAAAGGVYAYFHYTNPPPEPLEGSSMLKGYLIDASKYSKLAFPDANGDLVADTPATGPYLDPPELIFEEVAGDDPVVRSKQWDAFLKHLTTVTGKPTRYGRLAEISPAPGEEDAPKDRAMNVCGSVKQQIEALKAGEIQITAFTTGQVPMAVNAGGFVPLFAPADAAGKFGYEMEVIVPAVSPARSVADLKGKKVAFVALSSNSGAKAPLVIFEEKFGLKPSRDYEFQLTGRHDISMRMVAEGAVDAACVANDLLKGERTAGVLKDKPDAVRTIYTSETFPAVCFGIPHNLNPDLAAKVKSAFASFQFHGTGVGERYRGVQVKFVPVDYKKDWAFVRDIDERLVKNIQAK